MAVTLYVSTNGTLKALITPLCRVNKAIPYLPDITALRGCFLQ